MFSIVDNQIVGIFVQPDEHGAIALALLFNVNGWDTEAIDKALNGYTVKLTKGIIC